MSLAMSVDEREAFLAGVHVAVVSDSDSAHGPVAVPVWYTYEPGGEVRFATSPLSRKAKLIGSAGRFTLTVQNEALPYKYVSAEGTVSAVERLSEEERLDVAERYLGAELAAVYLNATADEAADEIVVRMRPQRWFSADYSKMTL